MIVACSGGSHPQQVGVHIDRTNDRREYSEEDRVVAGIIARRQQILAAICDGPVAVLARAIDAGERLLVQKANQIHLLGRLPENLHDEHVVVDRKV